MSDEVQDDMDQAAEYQQQLNEAHRRERELLARSPALHAELKEISRETHETCEAILRAVDQTFDEIFRP